MSEDALVTLNQAALTAAFELTPVGLIIKDSPDYAVWVALGGKLNQVHSAVHWWIGDWLNYGERAYGEMYSQALGETRFEYKTLATDKWVANRVESSRRRELLFWSHHREVASLPPEEQDYWLDRAEEEGFTQRQLRQVIRQSKKRLASGDFTAPEARLLLGDMRERGAEIDDETVDLIFTDPPYPEEYLHCWSDLSALAARVLKPNGLLISYSGQMFLPEVLTRLGEQLNYWWCGSVYLRGPHMQVFPRDIINLSKPLLFYTRGDVSLLNSIKDTYFSEGAEKDVHEWQQAIGEALYYIERLTHPGDMVFDPFLGSGTTGVAAIRLRRHFVGIDDDAVALESARVRIEKELETWQIGS